MKFVNIGFGNTVCAERIISVVSPDSSPIKRLVIDGKANGTVITVPLYFAQSGVDSKECVLPKRLKVSLQE